MSVHPACSVCNSDWIIKNITLFSTYKLLHLPCAFCVDSTAWFDLVPLIYIRPIRPTDIRRTYVRTIPFWWQFSVHCTTSCQLQNPNFAKNLQSVKKRNMGREGTRIILCTEWRQIPPWGAADTRYYPQNVSTGIINRNENFYTWNNVDFLKSNWNKLFCSYKDPNLETLNLRQQILQGIFSEKWTLFHTINEHIKNEWWVYRHVSDWCEWVPRI